MAKPREHRCDVSGCLRSPEARHRVVAGKGKCWGPTLQRTAGGQRVAGVQVGPAPHYPFPALLLLEGPSQSHMGRTPLCNCTPNIVLTLWKLPGGQMISLVLSLYPDPGPRAGCDSMLSPGLSPTGSSPRRGVPTIVSFPSKSTPKPCNPQQFWGNTGPWQKGSQEK